MLESSDTEWTWLEKYPGLLKVELLKESEEWFNMQDSKGDTLLHVAAQTGRTDLAEQIIAINIDQVNNDGNTALHIAVIHKQYEMINFLISKNASALILNFKNAYATDLLIENENIAIETQLYDYWQKQAAALPNEDQKRNLLSEMIQQGNKRHLKILLLAGLIPDQPMYDSAPPNIRKFFDYFPGLTCSGYQFKKEKLKESSSLNKEDMLEFDIQYRYPSIFECIIDTNKIALINGGLTNLIEDESNSSDEESSDDEIDDWRVVNSELTSELNEENQRFRGIHFYPLFFNTCARNEAKKPEFHKKDIYSLATTELAELKKINLEEADQLIKTKFDQLKEKEPVTEKKEDGKPRKRRKSQGDDANFSNCYRQLLHIYVNRNGCQHLFKESGISRDFKFETKSNPFLSTSSNEGKASGYARGSNTGIIDGTTFIPRKRNSTGIVKHRRLGYIQRYCVPEEKYQSGGFDVASEKISVGRFNSFNYEFIFESSIPGEYVHSYKMVSISSRRKNHDSRLLAQIDPDKARILSVSLNPSESAEVYAESQKAALLEPMKFLSISTNEAPTISAEVSDDFIVIQNYFQKQGQENLIPQIPSSRSGIVNLVKQFKDNPNAQALISNILTNDNSSGCSSSSIDANIQAWAKDFQTPGKIQLTEYHLRFLLFALQNMADPAQPVNPELTSSAAPSPSNG